MEQEEKSIKEKVVAMSDVDPVTGCWNWTGSLASKTDPLRKYGRITVKDEATRKYKTIGAHRFSYKAYNGDIPDGLFICHKCDNPQCVNPDHLFAGTRQDNVDDRERKGRNKIMYGEKQGIAKITNVQADEIRAMYAKGGISMRKIARIFGYICHKPVCNIIHNKTYINSTPTDHDGE